MPVLDPTPQSEHRRQRQSLKLQHLLSLQESNSLTRLQELELKRLLNNQAIQFEKDQERLRLAQVRRELGLLEQQHKPKVVKTHDSKGQKLFTGSNKEYDTEIQRAKLHFANFARHRIMDAYQWRRAWFAARGFSIPEIAHILCENLSLLHKRMKQVEYILERNPDVREYIKRHANHVAIADPTLGVSGENQDKRLQQLRENYK